MGTTYLLIKYLHISCAVLTLVGFMLRGYWMFVASPLLRTRVVRILPHAIDSVLLGSAIALVLISHQYPFVVNWVTAKVVLLVMYIGMGTIALKRGKTRRVRSFCFLLALLTISAIFAVAVTKGAGII